MYWRYFMWNFAGRQNDVQGSGNIINLTMAAAATPAANQLPTILQNLLAQHAATE